MSIHEQVKGSEEIRQVLGDIDYCQFTDLQELHLEQDTNADVLTWNMDLVLHRLRDETVYSAKFCFFGVCDLKIDDSIRYNGIAGFDVVDIRDRQLENIRYEVFDFEEDSILFCCSDVEIQEFKRIR